jgi:glycosyltransferase involved in cell wall biosynthesis
VFLKMREQVPLTLVGMGSLELGGRGEVPNRELPAFMADYRFFFNPIRYTSLGLSVLEAMMVGLPIVGLATTEMPTVIVNGVNGWLDTRPERLVDVMRQLVADRALARQWGDAARRTAQERFGIGRFTADWDRLLRRVAARSPA